MSWRRVLPIVLLACVLTPRHAFAQSFDEHANYPWCTVATAPSPATTGVTLTCASGQGARFPTPVTGYDVAISPANTKPTKDNTETARVTGKSTDVLTITRHVESSTARAIIVGDLVTLTPTAKVFTDIENAVWTSAHGGTGNAFTKFTGPTTSEKTFTLPNLNAVVLTDAAAVTMAQGGTGMTNATDDQTLVSSGTAWQAKTLPNCTDTGGNHLNYTQSSNSYSCGTSIGSGITASSTDTLTNKTIDAEGTGNHITLPSLISYLAAVCQNATATLGFSTPVSSPAVAACVTGTNTQFGVADFASASNLSVQGHFPLPTGWTGNLDLKGKWFSPATSGNVVWQLATAFVCDGATSDPSFNAANTVTDTTKGTANQQNDFSISALTTTGASAGCEMYWKLSRNAGSGSDTMTDTARLVALTFVVRRQIN